MFPRGHPKPRLSTETQRDTPSEAAPLGTPTTSETAPEAEAGPSLSDAAPAGNIGGGHAAVGHATQTEAAPEAETSAPTTSAFGPQSISLGDIAGAVYGPEADTISQAGNQQPSTEYAGPFSGPDVWGIAAATTSDHSPVPMS